VSYADAQRTYVTPASLHRFGALSDADAAAAGVTAPPSVSDTEVVKLTPSQAQALLESGKSAVTGRSAQAASAATAARAEAERLAAVAARAAAAVTAAKASGAADVASLEAAAEAAAQASAAAQARAQEATRAAAVAAAEEPGTATPAAAPAPPATAVGVSGSAGAGGEEVEEDEVVHVSMRGAVRGGAAVARALNRQGVVGVCKSMLLVSDVHLSGLPTTKTSLLVLSHTMGVILRAGSDRVESRSVPRANAADLVGPDDKFLFGDDATKHDFDAVDQMVVEVVEWFNGGSRALIGGTTVQLTDLFPRELSVDALVNAQVVTFALTSAQGLPAGEIKMQLTPYGYRLRPAGTVVPVDPPPLEVAPEPAAPADGDAATAPAASGAGAEGAGAGAAGAAAGPAKPAPPPKPPARNCLRIIAHGARDLLGQGMFGSACNPTARIDVGPFVARTKTAAGNQFPKWEQGWAFPIADESASVNVIVEHEGSLLEGGYQCLGRLILPLNTLAAGVAPGARVSVRNTLPLLSRDFDRDKPRGTIDL